MRRFRLLPLLAVAVLAGCGSGDAPPGFVARVGTAYLTRAELDAALSAAPAGMDSVTAREQVVEQWVTAQLMAQAAESQGLRERADVQRQLAENERAVLAAAYVGALYEEEAAALTRADIEGYFAQNRARLALREPYVRVRFIETRTAERAEAARAALQAAARAAPADSLWREAVAAFAADTAASLALARQYVPEGRLLRPDRPSPWQAVRQLDPGQISGVLEADSASFFVIQLVDRKPAGAEPELAWVEEEVRRQLAMQARKQLVARQVERLRAEAEARNDLEIPDRPRR